MKIHREPHVPREVVQNVYSYGGVDPKVVMAGAGASGSETGEGGAPMYLDAMRCAGFATSPFQWNVQFDRHPTEGVGLGFRR